MVRGGSNRKTRHWAGLWGDSELLLELFVEVAGGARDVDAAGDAALAVLYALDDARGLGALGAVGRLGGIHDLLTVTGFCNLSHELVFLLFGIVSAHARRIRAASTARSLARRTQMSLMGGLAPFSLH